MSIVCLGFWVSGIDNKHELSKFNVDSLFISAPKKSRYHWGTGVENLKKTTSATGTNTSIKQWALVTNRSGSVTKNMMVSFGIFVFKKKVTGNTGTGQVSKLCKRKLPKP